LQFNITTPSILRFLERIRKICSITDDQTFFFAQYIAEISLLDASLLKYRSSEIAAASILLSTKQLKKVNIWTKDIVKMTGIEEEPLQQVVAEVKSFAMEVNPKFLTTLKYKFSKPEYMEASSLSFKF